MPNGPDPEWNASVRRRAVARRDNWILLGLCFAVVIIILLVLHFAGALRSATD